jgi:hypothetical protein
MRPLLTKFRVPVAAVLFVCCSMYFGTGWSMGLFSFPIKPLLTVSNYALEFVPEVAAATYYFTYMTAIMLTAIAILIYTEWTTPYRWLPVFVGASVTTSTLLTVYVIFPYNNEMSAGITDPARLAAVLDIFMKLSWIRIALWSFQWSIMMLWFALQMRPLPAAALP